MARWNCYNKRGEWLGVVEGDSEEEAIKNADDLGYAGTDHAEERAEMDHSNR